MTDKSEPIECDVSINTSVYEITGPDDIPLMTLKPLIVQIFNMATDVFSILQTGHTEYIYHRALSMELQTNGILHETEKRLVITYKGFSLGEERIDIFLNRSKMIIELKAIAPKPREPELAQIRKYYRQLLVTGEENVNDWGIIINFPQPCANKPGGNKIDMLLVDLST